MMEVLVVMGVGDDGGGSDDGNEGADGRKEG